MELNQKMLGYSALYIGYVLIMHALFVGMFEPKEPFLALGLAIAAIFIVPWGLLKSAKSYRVIPLPDPEAIWMFILFMPLLVLVSGINAFRLFIAVTPYPVIWLATAGMGGVGVAILLVALVGMFREKD